MFFVDWKIKNKIFFGFLLAFFPALIISGLAIYQINKISQPIFFDLPEQITSLSTAANLDSLAQTIRYYDEVLTQAARNYAFTQEGKWKERYLEYTPKLDTAIKEAMAEGQETYDFFSSIDTANLALVEMETEAMDLVDDGQLVAAQKILDSEEYWNQKAVYSQGLVDYANKKKSSLHQSFNSSLQTSGVIINQTQEEIGFSEFLILFITIIFFLVVGLLVFLIPRFIASPLIKLKEAAIKISNGDLNQQVSLRSNDEIGILASVFNLMTKNLREDQANYEKEIVDKTKDLNKRNEDLEQGKAAILNILEDVEEEKKHSEALAADLKKFKLAVDNASDHIVITDVEGIVLYSNAAMEKITGYTTAEVLGKKAAVFWKLPMPLEYYQNFWNIIKTQKKVFVGEIKNRRKNGEEYDAQISVSPILDQNGTVAFFVGIEHDITKEKQIDRVKTEFVSLASHQLRTPLSAINWYTEMLLAGDAGKLNKEQKEYIEEVYKGNQRMVGLVNALLNVSRLELGTFMVEPKPCQITEVADSVLKELEPQINNRRQQLSKVYDEIPIIPLDEKLIRIVLQNLLSNAVKYTPEQGKITLEIKKKNRNLEIVVSDTGLGIPKNQQDKIFSKLFRADNVRESDTEGTGLGLYIVKSIIDQAGGTIKFKSPAFVETTAGKEENKGAIFTATLPLKGMLKKEGTKSLS